MKLLQKAPILSVFFILFLSCAKEKADWETLIQNSAQLTIVSISNKELGPIPSSISNLQKVEELQIPYNSISSLPDSFIELKELRLLNLYGNTLSSLPANFGNLPNLKVLLLGRTEIAEVPSSLPSLKNLEILALDETKIAFTDKDVEILAQIPNLKKLDLTLCRKITGLPKNLKLLGFLQELTLQKVMLEKEDVIRLRDELPKVRVKI